MFKQILVPVDGSDYATNAAKKHWNRSKHDSKITLLHVINHFSCLVWALLLCRLLQTI